MHANIHAKITSEGVRQHQVKGDETMFQEIKDCKTGFNDSFETWQHWNIILRLYRANNDNTVAKENTMLGQLWLHNNILFSKSMQNQKNPWYKDNFIFPIQISKQTYSFLELSVICLIAV